MFGMRLPLLLSQFVMETCGQHNPKRASLEL